MHRQDLVDVYFEWFVHRPNERIQQLLLDRQMAAYLAWLSEEFQRNHAKFQEAYLRAELVSGLR